VALEHLLKRHRRARQVVDQRPGQRFDAASVSDEELLLLGVVERRYAIGIAA